MKLSLIPVAISGCLVFSSLLWPARAAEAIEVGSSLRTINALGPKGAGHSAAITAWKQLSRAEAAEIPQILAGMRAGNPLAENWLRAAVEAIAQRALDDGGTLPQQELETFLNDTSHAPRARRLAYELILKVDPDAAERLLPGMLNDPSLELRRDAVAYAMDQTREMLAQGDPDVAREAYLEVLSAARDSDQVDELADRLSELGEDVDFPRHFGFLTTWKLIGPFDNKDTRGFNVAYGPEQDPDPSATFQGENGEVRWFDHTTDDPYGMVNLNEALGRYKGAIAYAYAEFYTDQPQQAEFRLGCITGNKLWVNGQLLAANLIYHSGSHMDQYVGRTTLQPGKNVILLKIAQNEQTEPWAQRWEFQLRVCDQYGTAILSEDNQ